MYVFLAIIFTVYGQLVLKWQIMQFGALPLSLSGKVFFLIRAMMNIWVISAFFSAFLAALVWMMAMTKLELNFAYPFMSLSFVLVLFFSVFFLHESMSLYKLLGVLLVVSGLLTLSMGK